jgi:hypothetical protein
MSSLRQKVADRVCLVLESFILSDPLDDSTNRMRIEMGHDAHDYLWPVDFHLVDPLVDELDGGDGFYLLHGEKEPPAVWPVDHGMVVIGTNDSKTNLKEGEIAFHRLVTVTPPDVRGLVNMTPQHMLALYQGGIRNGTREAWRDIYGKMSDKWVWLEKGRVINKFRGMRETAFSAKKDRENETFAQNAIELGLGMVLTERYSWHVAFGYNETGPRLVVPTNPTGCLALYKDRDKDEGRNRRAALRHWVENHYRSNIDDPGAITYVRDHLRGHTRFIWNDLFCELMVSQFDLEKNEFFKLQASEWRSQRKHNRVKLRRKAG